jgi:ABC-2 type transport system ATP-binding protein
MEKIIETFGLTKHFPKGVIGIKDLSLTVNPGEIYGFLGSNGAGKTTTIRLLLNLIFPTSGKGKIFGKDMVKKRLDISKNIGYIPGSVSPQKNMTGGDFLDYMGRFFAQRDAKYRRQLLDRFEFSAADLERPVKHYSSGMARKISIIQAFQHRPRLLIMDEPTEGLDPVMQHNFYELLKEYRNDGGTAFISSHHLREVEQVCDGAAIIRRGILVAVEKVKDLIEQMARPVHVIFKEKISRSKLESTAWEITSLDGRVLQAKLTGEINDIIKHLAQFPVEDLTLPNLSLEDVFLSYYREEKQ